MTHSVLAAAAGLWWVAGSVLADGIPFQDGRYDGPSTVLVLSKEQQAEADSSGQVTLTWSQRRQISRDRAPSVPRTVSAWSLQEAQGTCACELSDMGIRLSPDTLQVPHVYLGRADAWAREEASRMGPDQQVPSLWRHPIFIGGVSAIVAAVAWFLISHLRRKRA